ncbi:dTMP kinase, partial [Streptomyces sp. T21Q-yed]|nr:dTMP kinase [Streptomyces sp. T21Q-yed]
GPRPTGPAAGAAPGDAVTVPTPVVTPGQASGRASDETTVLRPVRGEERGGDRASDDGPAGERASGDRASGSRASGESDSEVTAKLPQPPVPSGAADETAVLPPVTPGAADETAVLPPVTPGAADETAVLPPVVPGTVEETAVLPPVSGSGSGAGEESAHRVPPGYFRDEERTREMPQVDESGAPRRRARSDWAEETPLDDLPTLADELLGPHEDEYDDEGGRGRGRRR